MPSLSISLLLACVLLVHVVGASSPDALDARCIRSNGSGRGNGKGRGHGRGRGRGKQAAGKCVTSISLCFTCTCSWCQFP